MWRVEKTHCSIGRYLGFRRRGNDDSRGYFIPLETDSARLCPRKEDEELELARVAFAVWAGPCG